MDIPIHLRLRSSEPKQDNRLLIKVTLVTTDRPTYQTIYCMNCGKAMGSIEHSQIFQVTDVDDDSWEIGKARLNIRCNGKFCRTLYRFTLN